MGNPNKGFKSCSLISALSLMERERAAPTHLQQSQVFTDIVLCHSKPGRCEKDVLYGMWEKDSY